MAARKPDTGGSGKGGSRPGTNASSKSGLKPFDIKKFEPLKVSKSGQGNEKLRYSNGDEFEGPMQYLQTIFNPVGQGKYRVAATGALYAGNFRDGQLEGAGTVTMPNGSVTVGTWENGNCIGTMKYENGDEYTGKIVRNVRSGQGATTYKNGAVFDGEWVDDIQHGPGKLTFKNGDHVEGTWNRGSCADGIGRRTCADGAVYTGQLSAISKHQLEEGKAGKHRGELEIDLEYAFFGTGTCDYADRSRYEGEWRDSLPNGQGALLHLDGSFFEGTWSRGKPQRGHGNIHSPKGWEYEGGILRSMRDGEGECSWPDLGMRYKGEWKNDRRSGRGKSVTEHDGHFAVYDGLWDDDMRSGQGEMYWPSGSSYSGEWKKDHPHGRGQAMYFDGRNFEGDFDPGPRRPGSKGVEVPGGVPCGRGRLEFPWGDVYAGEVQGGRPEGMGKLTTPNGDYVEGHFSDGFPAGNCTGQRTFDDDSVYKGDLQGWTAHGLGKLTFPDKKSFYFGPFIDGEPNGKGKFVQVNKDENGQQHEEVIFHGDLKEGMKAVKDRGLAVPFILSLR